MNDFESNVRQLLNEHVDEVTGAPRPAPVFEPTRTGRRAGPAGRRAPWVVPLLAAACVAAVVGGSLGVSQLLADGTHPSPGSSRPPVSAVPVRPTPSVTHHATPSHPYPTAQAKPGVRTVTLDSAAVYLPSGWTATGGFGGRRIESDAFAIWCLHPSGPRALTSPCPASFYELRNPLPGAAGIDFDVDHWAFGNGPEWCTAKVVWDLVGYGERQFGGRPAEWRYWHATCSTGKQLFVEQYVTTTSPVFALWSYQFATSEHSLLGRVARNSTLPAQNAPLRIFDRGYLRSVTAGPNGDVVTIDRVVWTSGRDGRDAYLNPSPETYTYVMPQALVNASHAHIGQVVTVVTDGYAVTSFG